MGLKQNVSVRDGLRYQGKGPMLAYILHRIGGLGMVVFVTIHVLASYLSTLSWATQLGIFLNSIYEHWAFQVFIFFFVLFHAINGLRIVIMDLWPKLVEFQREAIWLEWFVFIPVYSLALFVIIRSGLGG